MRNKRPCCDQAMPGCDHEVSEVRLRMARHAQLGESLRPISAGLCALLLFLAVSHALVLPTKIGTAMTVVASASAALLLVFHLIIRRSPIPPHLAHPAGACIAGLLLFNSLLHLYLTAEPRHTTNVALLLIGVGCFFSSARWLALIILLAFGGWLGVGWAESSSPPDRLHFAFMLLISAALSLMIHAGRLRARRQLEGMRLQDERRKMELEREVAERARTEETLRASKKRYHDLVEHSLGLICTHDLEGRLLSINPAAARLLGYEPAEMLGRSLVEFLAPSKRHLSGDYFDRIRQHPTDGGLMCVVSKEGEERLWSYRNVRFEEPGEAPYVIGYAQDVTEQKRAEEAFRKSEEYHKLFKLANDPIIIFDPEGGSVLDLNDKACAAYGRTREEFVGLSLKELAQDLRREEEHLAELLERGTYQAFESVQLRADGTPLHFLVNSSVIEYRGRRAVLSINRDITERKRAEEELRKSRERFEVVAQATSDVVWDWDFATGRVWRNEKIQALTGYPADEVASHLGWWRERLHPEDREWVLIKFREMTADGGKLWSDEYRLRRRDGTYAHVFDRGYLIYDGEGRPVRMIGSMADISRRKEAEEELRRSEERLRQLQKLEAVGRLAGGIAHEFNNLMTAIIGNSVLMLQDLSDTDQLREDVEEIKRAAERAACLTQQLLAFGRKQMLHTRVLSLNEVVVNAGEKLRCLLGEAITVGISLEPNLGCVEADAGQIEQAIINLAVNARAAMPDGGRLSIETRNVYLAGAAAGQLEAVRPGRYALLIVKDSGCGMDAETQRRVFEPFFTTGRFGERTGLGLSTVHGIIKQLGGEVRVQSEVELGTEFEIYLPQVACEEEAEEGGHVAGSDAKYL